EGPARQRARDDPGPGRRQLRRDARLRGGRPVLPEAGREDRVLAADRLRHEARDARRVLRRPREGGRERRDARVPGPPLRGGDPLAPREVLPAASARLDRGRDARRLARLRRLERLGPDRVASSRVRGAQVRRSPKAPAQSRLVLSLVTWGLFAFIVLGPLATVILFSFSDSLFRSVVPSTGKWYARILSEPGLLSPLLR